MDKKTCEHNYGLIIFNINGHKEHKWIRDEVTIQSILNSDGWDSIIERYDFFKYCPICGCQTEILDKTKRRQTNEM